VQKELQHSASGEFKQEPATATVLYRLPIPNQKLPPRIDPNGYGDTKSCLIEYERLGDAWAEAAKLLRQIDGEADQRLALKTIYLISQGKEE